MPLTGEAKRAYNQQYQQKKQLEKKTFGVGGEQTLQDFEKCRVLDEEGDKIPGEFHTWVDLCKVFYGVPKELEDEDLTPKKKKEAEKVINPSTHLFKGKRLSFDEWQEGRKMHRGDMWTMMQQRGEWNEQAHRPLADFFVKKDNSNLHVGYTQDQMNRCLLKQNLQHNLLLLFPRAFRKSTGAILDLVQWILNFPDIILLICTSTKSLGKKRVKELREYFTIKDYRNPTDFQAYFPDYCIPPDKGKKSGDVREFLCPMAHLGLPNPTASFTSMESGTAGVRADVILFDDAVDELNYKKWEMRQAVREKFDATCELLVRPFGFCIVIGTRYTDGSKGDTPDGPEPDLYGTIFKRQERSDKDDWRILCKAAWTRLEHAIDKPIQELEEADVSLLWPDPLSPGSFAVLKQKCSDNEMWFRCQQLNEPVAETDDEVPYINTFTIDNIRKVLLPPSWISEVIGPTYLLGDLAKTARETSDYSALVTVRIEARGEIEEPLIWFIDMQAGHWTEKEKALRIAQTMAKWQPEKTLVERLVDDSNLFRDEIRRQIVIHNCEYLNFSWFDTDNTPGAKETRIRGLQLLHERRLLRFISGPCTDLMIKQLTEYMGDKKKHVKSPGGRKDDLPDAMSFIRLLPLPFITGFQKDEEKEQLERQATRNRLLAQYEFIYGRNGGQPLSMLLNPPEDKVHDPIHDALAPLNYRSGPTVGFARKSPDGR
jgi:hypothetical protein